MSKHPEAPQYVVGRAERALGEEGMAELALQIAVRDDRVFVSGEVATEERRRRITELLEDALPDYEIHNQVSLAEVGGAAQPERLE